MVYFFNKVTCQRKPTHSLKWFQGIFLHFICSPHRVHCRIDDLHASDGLGPPWLWAGLETLTYIPWMGTFFKRHRTLKQCVVIQLYVSSCQIIIKAKSYDHAIDNDQDVRVCDEIWGKTLENKNAHSAGSVFCVPQFTLIKPYEVLAIKFKWACMWCAPRTPPSAFSRVGCTA